MLNHCFKLLVLIKNIFLAAVLGNSSLLGRMEKEWDKVAPISFQLPPKEAETASLTLRNFYLPNSGHSIANDSATSVGLGELYSDAVIGFPVHRCDVLFPIFQNSYSYEKKNIISSANIHKCTSGNCRFIFILFYIDAELSSFQVLQFKILCILNGFVIIKYSFLIC